MNRYFTEVIDAHVAIENWLEKGQGDEHALLARFEPDFSMIALNGGRLNFAALSAFFRAHRAAKPGLAIAIEEMVLVAEWPTGAVVSYRERQSLPGQAPTLRHSTVVFEQRPGGLGWRHLHETAIAP
ncbi:DUF4440 domain-containing protein [Serratia ficaria]|uniref:DUF4440 domain-containing protein n=1 Tax=Serratia TaxID=613 RepID=UPI00077C1ACB|nr:MULTISPECIES: DUF4440 domain-containing protein [Serratia]MEE4484753.1 DUF4440 domain-containing protein [Serratia ficaria]CAI1142800.1 Uncharacterized protein conserved in bacteria [Serratia ficaria]CAI1159810.1 Uncharacterized protein conserved in bacteria [Serratia ficaria]CAI1172250.1 Uncharacterized protein conserved in bacteria [Serratia ficaria]CAI1524473.1 Uncharacterized protein conserved in bacteria [Serratia ficaria]